MKESLHLILKTKPQNKLGIPFQENGVESKVIVISDGDIAKNTVSRKGKAGALGFDRYSGTQHANKKFLINCIDYLLESKDIITLRNREVKIRLMDKTKIKNEYKIWQVINTVLPSLLLFVFALITFILRKRKYTS